VPQPPRVTGEAKTSISVSGVSWQGSAAWVTMSTNPWSLAAAARIAGSAAQVYLSVRPVISALSGPAQVPSYARGTVAIGMPWPDDAG